MSKMNDLAIEFAENLMENEKKIIQNLSSNDFKNYILYGEKPINKKIKTQNGRNKRVKG